jgi:hypothetical protein
MGSAVSIGGSGTRSGLLIGGIKPVCFDENERNYLFPGSMLDGPFRIRDWAILSD